MIDEPRVVLVTGASSGIGRAVALRAAAEGDHVVLAARGKPTLDDVARQCDLGGAASTLAVATDVGDDPAVEALVGQILTTHGRLDAVAHCAGVVAYGRTEEVPAEVFDGVLRTNLVGSVNVSRHVIPVMRRQEHGAFVLIGSVIGHIGVPTMSPYVLSKWGVRALARQLQLENRDLDDLDISYVAPGGVDTPIYEQAGNYAGFIGRPPPPVASPEKVARIVLHRFEHPRPRTQVNFSNNLIRFGFTALPQLYDVLVGPLFRVAASDRTRPVGAFPGNVLESQGAGNRLRGEQGNPVVGIGRNLVTIARSIGRRGAA